MMENSIFVSEAVLDEKIDQFKAKFGVVDEGAVVSDDDYEKSVSLNYKDIEADDRRDLYE